MRRHAAERGLNMKNGIKAAMVRAAASAAIALSLTGAAFGQASSTYGKVEQPWYQQGKLASGISPTTTSSATLLPPLGLVAWICNTGAVDAYLNFGTANTVAATVAAGSLLKAGTCASYDLFPYFNPTRNGYVAAITGSSTTTLAVETGIGSGPSQAGVGSTISGTVIATQGTTPWLVAGQGTAGSPGTAVLTVQGISGGTPQPVALNTTPSLANGNGVVPTQGGVVLSQTNPTFSALTDGTNKAAVKAASTAPVAADPALVVSLNPVGNNVGGFEFQIAPTITVQNAAYSAGNAMGGLITVTGAARTNGGAGALNNIRLKSTGGSTNTLWVYAWSKTPTATCTDKAAYVPNAADNPFALGGFPTSVTLGGAPGAWDTSTYAQITGLFSNFKNQDTSPGTPIYLCLVTAGPVTPPTTADMTGIVSGIQD